MSSKSKEDKARYTLIPESLAIVFRRKGEADNSLPQDGIQRSSRSRPLFVPRQETGPGPPEDGVTLFRAFVQENSQCFWNPCLVQSVTILRYAGQLSPAVLLVTGTAYTLQVVRSAWARRVLRPPPGYDIQRLGDIPSVEMIVTAQTQFAPLAEALCEVVMSLNGQGQMATIETIARRLEKAFPEMVLPKNDLLYRTLGSLIKERKLYHTGRGYCVVTPQTYRLTTAGPIPAERQMLMTNEEAIVRLHRNPETKSCSVQTEEASTPKLERSHSMRMLRHHKEKISRSNSFKMATDSRSDSENSDPVKREKRSVFSRLFRRSQSHSRVDKRKAKHSSFSAQFPPPEWQATDSIHLHSRSTQTLEKDVVLRPKVHLLDTSSVHNRERHSIHIHPNVSTLRNGHQSRYDSDPFLRNKSSSLPRRSFAAIEVDEPPRRSSTPSTKRHVRSSSSPHRTVMERKHPSERSLDAIDKLNNGVDNVKIMNSTNKEKQSFNNVSSPSRKVTRNVRDGCFLQNEKISNHQKSNVWVDDDQRKTDNFSKDFGHQERFNSVKTNHEKMHDDLTVKKPVQRLILNETVDLEVNFKSKSLDDKMLKQNKQPAGNHTISIKTASTHRPVSITTVTSITTSLSQNALKDSDKLINDKARSRSAESTPLHQNLKMKDDFNFSPVKIIPKNLIPDSSIQSGGDDSGFVSISPDTSYHEIR